LEVVDSTAFTREESEPMRDACTERTRLSEHLKSGITVIMSTEASTTVVAVSK